VQGQITYRIADPKKAAAMLDFTIDAKGNTSATSIRSSRSG